MRFGIWALVHGSRGTFHDPEEPFDASWDRNRRLVLEAESLGFDSTLIAQHTANPYDDDWDELEAWTASAALAALTQRIEIITAVKPPLYHPVILAKMAQQIEHVSGGRFGINLVNAWNRAEYEKAGIDFAEHDERYAYGQEWIAVVDALLRGERVFHRGRHFQIDGFQIRPSDSFRARPSIYVGGESQPAQELVARHGDVWFINGQSLENVARLIANARSLPRRGEPLGFGLSAFVIARPTAAEAEDAFNRLVALSAQDAEIRARQRANTDPAVVMKHSQVPQNRPTIGTNGGTAAGLVGSYDQVAERMRAFHAAGIELFMLQFQPFEAEMRRFAAELMPRLR
ncbi:LLM class flavin-dependent oxidoreductase [Acidisoma cellulosilytica]|uniref:LLM class flavin-dependent oxidoreductase n=1 Tax=Acidisoma cellulosilyticum TaxID=2802395 RepID=A0A963Z4G2_9PROT|nr:LLM class flavin-dependent oxidoreductase [Acidisoma cellulosilyticum]MCB8882607.1 LLM class flavin-dependent oxidoreductase [Acidisoma cellulosilyticum]